MTSEQKSVRNIATQQTNIQNKNKKHKRVHL